MAQIAADRVRDVTSTTGTGDITLSNTPPTGFRTLAAVAATSDTFFYCVELGAEWEVGLGTYLGANVFARTTVLSSSNANSLVNFSSGNKNFFITLPASKLADNTAFALSWDGDTTTAPSKNAVYDKFEAGFHANYVAGRWYVLDPPHIKRAPMTGFALNTVTLTPFWLPRRVTISDLGARIPNSGVAGNMQLAIYAANPATGDPTGDPVAKTLNISTASAGTLTGDIDGANVTLDAGLYWSAVNCSATIELFGADNATTGLAHFRGSTSASDMVASFGGLSLTIAQTFGTWPNLTSASYGTLNVAVSLLIKAA